MVIESKKRIVLITLVILAFLISGCGQQSGVQVSSPFAGGSQGLVLSFIPGAPPDNIFDDAKFPFGISVMLNNAGEYDIQPNDGYIEIVGISPKDFGLASQANLKQNIPYMLKGAKKNFDGTVIAGEQNVISFDRLNYMPNIVGNYAGFKIRANVCYNYKTSISSQLCVKKNLITNIQTKEICDITGPKFIANSGGPIQAIDLKQYPIGDSKLQIAFTIAQVGGSEDRFYKLNTNCEDITTNLNKDIVHIKMGDINGKRPSCTGLQNPTADSSEGDITLFNGAARPVICSLDTTGVDYVAQVPLNFELSYRYSQFIEKPIMIQDVTLQ